MDYELMMNSNIRIGQKAPSFNAVTTNGNKTLEDFKGRWLILFSYPGDFTYISEAEMLEFCKAYPYFEKLDTELIGLSIDSIDVHFAWIKDIYLKKGINLSFPLIADRSGEIARLYGMISKDISSTEALRNVVIIDEDQIVRAIFSYPVTIPRSIPEILRTVKYLKH